MGAGCWVGELVELVELVGLVELGELVELGGALNILSKRVAVIQKQDR